MTKLCSLLWKNRKFDIPIKNGEMGELANIFYEA